MTTTTATMGNRQDNKGDRNRNKGSEVKGKEPR